MMRIRLFKKILLISIIFIVISFITFNYFLNIREPVNETNNFIIAATYYGNSWVINFWNSDFSSIDQDMLKIKNDGFNTLILMVPWGEFQTGISPIKFNEVAFKRLKYVIEKANQYNLDVILRISYAHDFDPDDQLPRKQRFLALFKDQIVYDAWLSYIHEIYMNVKDYKNVKFALISWEDLFEPVSKATFTQKLSDRIELAHQIGFSQYLYNRYDLKQISEIYGYSINSEGDIPTPLRNSTAFLLFLQFYDEVLIKKIFEPAQVQFPNLSMEVRVDYDPIYYSNGTIDWFSHSSTYDLPGAEYTTIYYSTSMGATNNYNKISSAEATSLMNYFFLHNIKNYTQGKKIFIDQFIWSDNTPGFESNTKIYPHEINSFLHNACYIMKNYTDGYGIWTYKDYKANIIYNPSFSLGTKGWIVDGNFYIKDNEIILNNGTTLTQLTLISPGDSYILSPNEIRTMLDLSFYTKAITSNAKIKIEFGDNILVQTVNNTGSTYHYNLINSVPKDSNITFQILDGSISLSNVELYNFVAHGEIYDVDFNPEKFLEPVRQLNKCLLEN